MQQAVKNMHELAAVPLREAIAMASLNPARAIGIDRERGSVEEGKIADIVVLDRNLDVQLTMMEGRIVFFREGGTAGLGP